MAPVQRITLLCLIGLQVAAAGKFTSLASKTALTIGVNSSQEARSAACPTTDKTQIDCNGVFGRSVQANSCVHVAKTKGGDCNSYCESLATGYKCTDAASDSPGCTIGKYVPCTKTYSSYICVCTPPSWSVGNYPKSCSDTCGAPAETLTRSVTCTSSDGAVVPDSSCPTPKPSTTLQCPAKPPCEWEVTEFPACPTRCGSAPVDYSRSVICKDPSDALAAPAEQLCTGVKPPTTMSCAAAPQCRWSTSTFPACPTACGTAASTVTRGVECHDGMGATMTDESLCSEAKPAVSQQCPATSACGPSMTLVSSVKKQCRNKKSTNLYVTFSDTSTHQQCADECWGLGYKQFFFIVGQNGRCWCSKDNCSKRETTSGDRKIYQMS